jgi:hypothetical protein
MVHTAFSGFVTSAGTAFFEQSLDEYPEGHATGACILT